MKRKVIQIADTTFVVSLPLKWAREHNVKKGDEVDIQEAGSVITLRLVNSEKQLKKIRINLKAMDFFTTRIIASLYKDGFDEIEIEYDDPEKLKQILNLYFIGYEIVKFEKGVYTIRTISDIVDSEIDPMLRRTFILLKLMGFDLVNAIKNKDIEAIKSIKASEESNNRFTSYLRRALMKKELYEPETRILKYLIIEEMEKLADEYKYLCQYLLENPKNIVFKSPELFLAVDNTAKIVEGFYDLYYNFSLSEAKNIALQRKELVKKIHLLFETKHSAEFRVAHYLLNIVQSTANMLSFRISMHFLEAKQTQVKSDA